MSSLLPQGVLSNNAPPEKYGPGLRMNQMQVIGTHNSYHQEVSEAEKPWHTLLNGGPGYENLYYSHATLDAQFANQSVRNVELDIWADPDGGRYAKPLIRRLSGVELPPDPAMNQSGTKILHVPDLDVTSTCYTLVECLKVIRDWSRANPGHVPISSMIEFKHDDSRTWYGGTETLWWNDTARLDALDEEFRSVFDPEDLITPDDVRYGNLTLEQSVLQQGWPTLEWARGKVMFFMDNGEGLGAVRNASIQGRPNLEGRVIFTQSVPGEWDCAFQKLNQPVGDENQAKIQEQVRKGYWVRTRADEPITTVLQHNTTMRDCALASGAQIVSTDFPTMGMAARWFSDYVVRFPGGVPARCNPISAPDGCGDLVFEPEYQP